MSKVSKIMLVKNRALGDSIMGLSAVQYLKQLYPESNIIYAVPQWIAPIYSQTKTSADTIYPLSLSTISDVFKLFKDLKKFEIEHIHEMHQSGRGAKIFKLLSLILGIRYTAHNHHLKSPTKVINQGQILPLIQRDLDGVFSFLGKGDRPNYLNFEPEMFPQVENQKEQLIIMGVVATRSTKMWPLENYVELARLIYEKNPQYKILIPLSKSLADKKIKEKLLTLGLPSNTSIVEWSLEVIAFEFKKAKMYIGNDTGLKHLAVAVGVKTYTFFGPEPANEWHPYDLKKHSYFYLENLACRTRTGHYCGLSECNLAVDTLKCLTHFSPINAFENINWI